jgi:hypothetical protein
MLSYIAKMFKIEKPKYPFDSQYRNGYSKLWINSLKNYTP